MNTNALMMDSNMTNQSLESAPNFNVVQALVCVSMPEPYESPASWLSRTALNQGVSIEQILAYLGLKIEGDIDIEFALKVDEKTAQLCGLPVSSFSFMKHMFSQVSKIDEEGIIFLLTEGSFARYRYCAHCLKEQHTPHFPLHWRFKAWQWCPVHDCLLNDCCPHCYSVLILPQNLINAGPRAKGVAYLSRCHSCDKALTIIKSSGLFSKYMKSLKPSDQLLLSNGRALLAALFYGEFRLGKLPNKYPLSQLRDLAKNGQLPHEVM
jgi:TniQ